jgi:hypothetical protein
MKPRFRGRPAAAILPVLSCCLALLACGRAGKPDPGPEETALELFELARAPLGEGPDDAALVTMFGVEAGDPARVSLLEALDALAGAGTPSVVSVQPLDTLHRVAVDLEAESPAGGSARYSVQVERGAGGGWVVRWFQGPDLGWPAERPPRGEGLTTSSGPG